MIKKLYITLFFFLTLSNQYMPQEKKPGLLNNNFTTGKDSLLIEMEFVLKQELDLFYPLSLDKEYGGYFSDINYKWELEGEQNKMIVTQSRHIWTASRASVFFSNNEFIAIAKHGYEFLKDKMWDKEYGGFFELVNREGEPLDEIKRAYGNSFAIYGLAAYYEASGDTGALELAKKTFLWLEKHSYDPEFGGYYQFLERDGTPLKNGHGNETAKDQNSSIHLLEAFTELYKVWKDPLLKERLIYMLQLVRDKITTDKGYVNLFFEKDWTPISFRKAGEAERSQNYSLDHVSFGHDIEIAYLIIEASEVLGIHDDEVTLSKAKLMTDHSLRYGLDTENFGIFDGGYYFEGAESPQIIKNSKEWWGQAEGMNTCLIMAGIYPDDPMNYYDKFLRMWHYIKAYVIDHENGGWYWGGIDMVPENKQGPKASIWKANYHTFRSLSNCIKNLSAGKE